ncbi:MAG: helix-turn-helix domain-containing protein, partial [Thermoprotei archaeon]
ALSSKPETLKVARKLVSYDHYLRKVKIKKITYHYANDYTVIYAIKSMCEFYKLIEENKISILSPYLFNKGRREYIVIGSSKAVANYLADLRNYYGEDNVTWQALALEDLVKELVKTSILNLIEEKLTSSEKRTLLIAYKYGYFDYPKNAKQEDLGSVLNLSKVTISIHIRKALKKIMNQIIGIFEES